MHMSSSRGEVVDLLKQIRAEFKGPLLGEVAKLKHTAVMKSDSSYVTQGDLLVQQMIARLAEGLSCSPRIVSEEMELTAASNLTDGITLVVDPLDGTENFASGLPLWGVSVSCYEDGVHLASLIGCPELGAWLQTGDVSAPLFSSRVRGLSSSLDKAQLAQATDGFEYRIFGCCVFNMLSVIRGSLCSFENPKGAWPWDILAGLNLALEAGLQVVVENKQYAGEYLAPDRRYRFKVEQR